MAGFVTINPATEEKIAEYQYQSDEAVAGNLGRCERGFEYIAKKSLSDRLKIISSVKLAVKECKFKLSALMTEEMGKPLKEAQAEVEKINLLCEYYEQNAAAMLSQVNIDSKRSFRYEPMGTIFAIMPWNFPLWQVFRHAIPAIALGNNVALKHADNTAGCAQAIESLFADVCSDVVVNFRVTHQQAGEIIKCRQIRGVTLTGSSRAGSQVASLAGQFLKKSVLELGGSDAYLVLDGENIEKTVAVCSRARLLNAGQTCIAAKRFIVIDKVFEDFVDRLCAQFKAVMVGDPKDSSSDMGPLARKDIRDNALAQQGDAISKGAQVVLESRPSEKGYYLTPGILAGVEPGMSVFSEEVFAPIAVVMKVATVEEAIAVANDCRYGLGAAIFGADEERCLSVASRLDVGNVAINDFVKSDPTLPFGGVKDSGYGRELSAYGLYEFANIKSYVLG